MKEDREYNVVVHEFGLIKYHKINISVLGVKELLDMYDYKNDWQPYLHISPNEVLTITPPKTSSMTITYAKHYKEIKNG